MHRSNIEGRLGQNGNLTKRSIMAAILQTTGPISTHRVVRLSWKFLRMVSVKQFEAASQELEKLGMGILMTCQGSGKLSVFIKKLPSEIGAFLMENQDLCPLEYYTSRFFQPSSKMIKDRVKNQLVADGVVSPHLFIPRKDDGHL